MLQFEGIIRGDLGHSVRRKRAERDGASSEEREIARRRRETVPPTTPSPALISPYRCSRRLVRVVSILAIRYPRVFFSVSAVPRDPGEPKPALDKCGFVFRWCSLRHTFRNVRSESDSLMWPLWAVNPDR